MRSCESWVQLGQNRLRGYWRAGWDSNPRFAAPQAAVLVLARLPARRRATDSFPYNAIISTQSEIRLVTSDSRSVSYASEKGEMDSHVYLQQVSEARIPDHSVVRDATAR